MPREILTPQAGFFGKLPSTGDFVARGLPDAFRGHWDAWVTQHLAGRLKDRGTWPAKGLRFRLVSGGRVAAGVIVPGEDSAGRVFPLSLLLIGTDLPAPAGLDPWCDSALASAASAQRGEMDADALLAALHEAPVPDGQGENLPGMELWTAGLSQVQCDPTAPSATIDRIFLVSCC